MRYKRYAYRKNYGIPRILGNYVHIQSVPGTLSSPLESPGIRLGDISKPNVERALTYSLAHYKNMVVLMTY